MSRYHLYGVGLTLVGVTLVGIWVTADNAINYVRTEGRVVRIVRVCEFHTAVRRTLSEGTKVLNESMREDCDATGQLTSLLNQGPRPTRKVKGEATISVSYYSPRDKTLQTASYLLDGSDNTFYTLREGAQITIYVHKGEPNSTKPLTVN